MERTGSIRSSSVKALIWFTMLCMRSTRMGSACAALLWERSTMEREADSLVVDTSVRVRMVEASEGRASEPDNTPPTSSSFSSNTVARGAARVARVECARHSTA